MTSSDNIVRPKWMEDDFLKTCIRSSKNLPIDSNIHIEQVDLSRVVPKGENYMSIIHRVTVKYSIINNNESNGDDLDEAEEVSFVVKVVNEEDVKAVGMAEPLFSREISVYKNIIPSLRNDFGQLEVTSKMFPKLVHEIEVNPRVIVFEDLKPQGFIMADKYKGFDLPHCKYILRHLAQYHATTMCYFQKQPDDSKIMYKESVFATQGDTMNKDMFVRSVKKRLEGISAELKKIDTKKYNKPQRYLTNVMEWGGDIFLQLTPYQQGNKFNGLNHTDFWVNNIMLKYKEGEEGTIQNIAFVDFQLCTYTSISYDFNTFFFSSVNMEVRRKSYVELREHYFAHLTDSLQKLEYQGEIPTSEEYTENLKEGAFNVVMTMVMLLSIILKKHNNHATSKEDSNAFTMDELLNMVGEGSDQLYLDTVVASIDVMLENGYFDNVVI